MKTIRVRVSSARRMTVQLLFLVTVLALVCTLGVGSASAAAATTTTNYTEYTELLVYVPCAAGGAGEYVFLSGPLHILFVTTLDNQGGYHLKFLFQPQGISGTGLTTGDRYQATGETQETFNAVVGLQDTYVNNFKIIGVGSGNNYLVHETLHFTLNSSGVVTAFVDNFSVECR